MKARAPFQELETHHYGVVLADPPWPFRVRSAKGEGRSPKYARMSIDEIAALPVGDLAGDDCALFLWVCWPTIPEVFRVIEAWGFSYKTAGFVWLKADPLCFFAKPFAGLGYWSRSNTEVCLLATRGHPKRLHKDVHQAIIAPRREHSRKPDEGYDRIERLVAGPYVELFARQTHPGWDSWGDQINKFDPAAPRLSLPADLDIRKTCLYRPPVVAP